VEQVRIEIKIIFFVKNQTWNPISLSQFPFMCGIGIGIDIFEKKD